MTSATASATCARILQHTSASVKITHSTTSGAWDCERDADSVSTTTMAKMLLPPLDEFDAEKWCWAKSSEEGTRDAAHRVSMQCERARWRCKVIDAVWCAREIDVGG